MSSENKELPEIIRSADYKELYCNFVHATYTFFDVALNLNEYRGAQMIERSRVTMSPAEAKLLVNILTNTVTNYEDQFGVINIPEGLAVPLNPKKS